jgi:hypothetical protein
VEIFKALEELPRIELEIAFTLQLFWVPYELNFRQLKAFFGFSRRTAVF